MKKMFTSVTPMVVDRDGGLLADDFDGWFPVSEDGVVATDDRIMVAAANRHGGPDWSFVDRVADAYYGHRHEKVGVVLTAPRDEVLPVSVCTSAFKTAQVAGLIDEQPDAERPGTWEARVGGLVRPLRTAYVVTWLYVALGAAGIVAGTAPVDLWVRFALPGAVLPLIALGHLAFRASVRTWRWRAHEAARTWSERLDVPLYGSRDEACADQPVSQRILYPHEVREREEKKATVKHRQLLREGVTASLDELSSEAFQGQVSPEVRDRLMGLSTRIKQVA